MRVGIIGRSELLLNSAKAVAEAGHEIAFVYTCKSEAYYSAHEDDFAAFAKSHAAPFYCDVHIAARAKELKALGAEIAISVNWLTLLKDEVLTLFPHGVLNAHMGDLPRFRGNACPNWAMLMGEERVGLSVHQMVEALDAGPVACKAFLPLTEQTYIADVYAWAAEMTPTLFVQALAELRFEEQDAGVVPLRCFPRRAEDARINWKASVRDVLALVRASSVPLDGAFTTLEGGMVVRVWRAARFEPGVDFMAVPGQVCLMDEGCPVIAAGDGMVKIEQCSSEDGDEVIDDAMTKVLIGRSLRNRLV